MAKRDTTRYQHKEPGGNILHPGITQRTLEEREREHKRNYGENTYSVKIGPKVSKESALKWERDGGKRLRRGG